MSVVALAALLSGLVSACDLGSDDKGSGATAPGNTTTSAEVDIRSSLEGMEILPRHVPWTATVSLPPKRIKEVQFRIDKALMWVDAEPPYSYGETGAVLPTSIVFNPWNDKEGGRGHHFTVRVEGVDGSTWRARVVARVNAPRIAKRAPVYAAVWGRLPPAAAANHALARDYDLSAYTALLWTGGAELWVGRAFEHAYAYELSATKSRFRVGPPIYRGSDGTISGWTFRGYQCPPDDPPGTYRWSRTEPFGPDNEKYLVLKATNDPCPKRQRLLEGVWDLL
jgi:hypothetical protein